MSFDGSQIPKRLTFPNQRSSGGQVARQYELLAHSNARFDGDFVSLDSIEPATIVLALDKGQLPSVLLKQRRTSLNTGGFGI